MGAFDDLIPAQPTAGAFDDLIPKKKEEKTNIIDEFILDKFGPQLARAPDLLKGTSGRLGASRVESVLRGGAEAQTGLTQLGANITGVGKDAVNQFVAEQEAESEAGRKAAGREGFDAFRLGGSLLATGGPAAKLIKPAAKALGRIGQGAAIGAGAGATATVTDSENYWTTKGGQTLLGLATGAAIPSGIEGTKFALKAGKGLTDLITEKGAGRILTDYQKGLVGEEGLPKVVKALETRGPAVPGYKQTAAEKLVNTPEGSPLFTHQRVTAEQPKGVSAEFGLFKQAQEAALKAAPKKLDKITDPMREKALTLANRGGVKTQPITAGMDRMLRKKGIRASDTAQKTMTETRDKILDLTNSKGVIDARDLYTVRKEMGLTIEKFTKDLSKWDKKLVGKLERETQKLIDQQIEKAGGKGWKNYLLRYSKGRESIKRATESREGSPIQPTNIAGGRNIAEETRIHLPQMLSRPMMITNAILNKIGRGVETRIDPQATARYLDPQKLANELKNIPLTERMGVIGIMIQRGYIPAVVGVGQEGIPQ